MRVLPALIDDEWDSLGDGALASYETMMASLASKHAYRLPAPRRMPPTSATSFSR